MSEANKAIVRRWFEEVWNQGRTETIDALFARNARAHGLGDLSPGTPSCWNMLTRSPSAITSSRP
jgi:hypothetical protein